MKNKTFYIIVGVILGLLLGATVTVRAAQILFPTGGGTGWANLESGTILYGNGTNRIATSSSLTFDGTRFKTTYASTTALSASGQIFVTGGNAGNAPNIALTSGGTTGLYLNGSSAALTTGGVGVTWGSLSGVLSWYPNTDNIRSLGGASNRWLNYWGSGTATTSVLAITGLTSTPLLATNSLGQVIAATTPVAVSLGGTGLSSCTNNYVMTGGATISCESTLTYDGSQLTQSVSSAGLTSFAVFNNTSTDPTAGTRLVVRTTGEGDSLVNYLSDSDGLAPQWATGVDGTTGFFGIDASNQITTSPELTIDGTNRRVGIATSTPGYTLSVHGSASFGSSVAVSRRLDIGTDGAMNFWYSDNGLRTFLTANNPGITAANQGNQILFRQSSTTDNVINAGAIRSVTEGSYADATTDNSALTFLTADSGTLAEVLRLTSQGLVNIGGGTTQNTGRLTVVATSTATTFDANQLTLRSNRAAISASTPLVGGIGFETNDTNLTQPGLVVAGIQAVAAGTHTAASQLTDLIFSTTATGGTATNTEKMRITGPGLVGIGTTTPLAELNIFAAATPESRIGWSTNTSFGQHTFVENGTRIGLVQVIGSAFATTDRQNDVEVIADTGDISFWPGLAQSVTFKSSGNVGIGTTSPQYPLSIGSTDVTSTPWIGVGLTGSNYALGVSEGRAMFGYSNNDLVLNGGSGKGISFFVGGTNGTFTSGTQAMRINSSGLVGIGTTTPVYTLSVQYSSDGNMFQLYDTDGNCLQNPESGAITTTCTSDEKLKENIRNTELTATEYFKDFKIRDYEVKSSGDTMTGVIAQEVRETHPELVKDIAPVITEEIILPNGEATTTSRLGDTTEFVEIPSTWQLIKAIQELDARVTALEAEKKVVAADSTTKGAAGGAAVVLAGLGAWAISRRKE